LTLKRQPGRALAALEPHARPSGGARSAAERARAWRQRQHAEALSDVLGLLATLPDVAIAEAFGRLTTGQLQQLGHHLLAVTIRQTRHDLELEQGDGTSVRVGANAQNGLAQETG